ncbi:ATP-binding cassette domain-containing protein [Methylomagnum sp.]
MLERQTIEFRSSYTRKKITRDLAMGDIRTVGVNSDIALDGPDVRRNHAMLSLKPEGWQVSPTGAGAVSINGEELTGPRLLSDGDWLSLDKTLFQVSLPSGTHATPTTRPVRHAKAQSGVLTIGRLPGCDLVLPSPVVSREHARLYCEPAGVDIQDLGSINGTYINGERLQGRTRLTQGDRVAIGAFSFSFTGEALEPIDSSGRVRVEVRGLFKDVVDHATKAAKRLLDDINLVIEPGEFVVVFGTSGSGKSTLLDALNGRRPATGGQVLYNGQDLYASFDAFRASIGYVPQQDIVHRKITTGRALDYTARLRLPRDTDASEIHGHTLRVLGKVGLEDKADSPIDTPAPLSGGQLKRVSLAVGLVSNPNILFLDEVTSGLDAGTDKRMMRLFADLAADGKTVVCITHTLENIDACKLVVLLHKGRLVYFGPPGEACAYFGVERLSGVYDLLEDGPTTPRAWAEKFRASPLYSRFITDRMAPAGQSQEPARAVRAPGAARSRFDLRQTYTLTRRYFDLVLSDRRNLLIMLSQAPLIAVLIGLVFKVDGSLLEKARAESTISFILVLSAIWFGTLNSAREVVKELPVYLRERSVNLGIGPYLTSKLLPLALLCLLQCLMLLGVVAGLLPLTLGLPGSLGALFLAAFSATCMGLAVSAFVDTNDKAVAMAPILLVPQVVLSNAVVQLGDTGQWVAKASMISFWALDAMKNTLPAKTLALRDPLGNLAVSVSGDLGRDFGMVGLLALGFVAVAVVGLKFKDRHQ